MRVGVVMGKEALGKFISKKFGFSLEVSFHQPSILVFILKVLLQNEKRAEPRKLLIKDNLFLEWDIYCFL
jgi:hypothetical protein